MGGDCRAGVPLSVDRTDRCRADRRLAAKRRRGHAGRSSHAGSRRRRGGPVGHRARGRRDRIAPARGPGLPDSQRPQAERPRARGALCGRTKAGRRRSAALGGPLPVAGREPAAAHVPQGPRGAAGLRESKLSQRNRPPLGAARGQDRLRPVSAAPRGEISPGRRAGHFVAAGFRGRGRAPPAPRRNHLCAGAQVARLRRARQRRRHSRNVLGRLGANGPKKRCEPATPASAA